MLYEMLFGNSPFKKKNGANYNIINSIKHARYTFPEDIKVSEEAKDLIKRLLTVNPVERLGYTGATEIMDHPFFKSIDWDDIFKRRLDAPIRVKVPQRRKRAVR